jgi:hypothetical protein
MKSNSQLRSKQEFSLRMSENSLTFSSEAKQDYTFGQDVTLYYDLVKCPF